MTCTLSTPLASIQRQMTLLVKICGLKHPDALEVALEAGADMVGFVFFPPSPRHVDHHGRPRAGRAGARPRAEGGAVGRRRPTPTSPPPSRRSSPTCCNCTARRRRSASPRCAARFGLPVMKALPISERSDLARDPALRQGRRPADLRCPAAARRHPAGRPRPRVRLAPAARARDRDPLHAVGRARCRQRRGGAAHHAAPGVDVSSGVERAPGEKDRGQDPRFHPGRARGHAAIRQPETRE